MSMVIFQSSFLVDGYRWITLEINSYHPKKGFLHWLLRESRNHQGFNTWLSIWWSEFKLWLNETTYCQQKAFSINYVSSPSVIRWAAICFPSSPSSIDNQYLVFFYCITKESLLTSSAKGRTSHPVRYWEVLQEWELLCHHMASLHFVFRILHLLLPALLAQQIWHKIHNTWHIYYRL